MICAHCSELTVLDPCPHCGRTPWLDGRYELLEVLGSGDEGTTFSARRRGDRDAEGSLEILRVRAGDDRPIEGQGGETGDLRPLDPSADAVYLETFLAGEGAGVAVYQVREPAEEEDPAGEEDPAEEAAEAPDVASPGNLGDAVEAARDEDLERSARTRVLKVSFVILIVTVGIGLAATLVTLLPPLTADVDPGPGGEASPRSAPVDVPPPPEPEPTPTDEGALPPHQIDEASRVDVGPGTYPPRGGESGAAVTIVLFSDFGCVYCAHLAPAMAEIDGEYGQRVAVHFRDYPLDIHRHSMGAHIAARCGQAQGRFWVVHDQLFGHWREHEPAQLVEYARDAGLDVQTFQTCLTSEAMRALVETDRQAGEDVGVKSTPTYFINGVPYSGRRNAAQLSRLIDAELNLTGTGPLTPGPP